MNTSLDRNEAAALETGEIKDPDNGIAINEMEVFGTPYKG
jgi:hypothetical protein